MTGVNTKRQGEFYCKLNKESTTRESVNLSINTSEFGRLKHVLRNL